MPKLAFLVSRCALVLLAAACTEPDAVGTRHDSAPDDDTAAAIGGIELGGVRVCEDPSVRDMAPLYQPEAPGDFVTVQPAGSVEELTGWGVSVGDFDGDGFLDVLLPQVGVLQLFRGDGTGRLDLMADAFPPGEARVLQATSAADADGDGDLDLYLACPGPDVLWINDGSGHFSDGTLAAGLGADPYDGTSSAWADYDGDGDLDLYVSNYWTEALHPDRGENGWEGDPNRVWQNQGDGTFVDQSGLLHWTNASLGFTYGGGWWDVDGDALPELLVMNDKGYLGFANAFAKNEGGRFTDAGVSAGLDQVMLGMGVGVADLNDDAVPDFLLADWGKLWLMLSDGAGGWYDAAFALGLSLPLDDNRIVAWGVELADLDNDGDDDAAVTFGNDNFAADSERKGTYSPQRQVDGLWLQGDDGHFVQHADEWGFSGEPTAGHGFGLADLDGNGWLDFVRRDLLGVSRLDMQACGDAAWLVVALSGPAPNTQGVGARIEVESGGKRWIRWVHAGSTNMASSMAAEAHFGLGSHLGADDTIDTVRVVWPDRTEQVFTGIEARQRVVVLRD